MPNKFLAAAFAFLLLVSTNVKAEPDGFRAFDLPQHGSLQITVPLTWNDQLSQRQEGLPPTILFTPEHGHGFNVQIMPLWPRQEIAIPGLEEIRRLISKAADDEKLLAVESDIPIHEIQGTSGDGYYFNVTYRVPKVDEFNQMTRGMLRVGELVLAFTIFSSDGAETSMTQALTMLKSVRQVAAVQH
ncbi:MAG: hypothetical protein WAO76_14120 [Georgfuchsia sp.]